MSGGDEAENEPAVSHSDVPDSSSLRDDQQLIYCIIGNELIVKRADPYFFIFLFWNQSWRRVRAN